MEGLECDVCHEIMNEDELRPRSMKCGHTACTICINKLIRNNTLECPSCRQSYQIHDINDLPVNFGMMKMIRALKGVTISSEPYGASSIPADKNLCSIHGSNIINRCQKCQVWICEHCLELHKQELGCSVTSVEDALKNIKDNHIKSAQSYINIFKLNMNNISDKVSGIKEKIKKLKEYETKYNQLLRDGNSALDAVVASHNSLANANNRQDVNDHVQVSLQRECYLDLWTRKNIGKMSIFLEKAQQQQPPPPPPQQSSTDWGSLGVDRSRAPNIPDSRQIYVGNLTNATTEEELKTEFSRFGKIVDIRIILKEMGNFGFVSFEDENAVTNVLANIPTHLNGNYYIKVDAKRSRLPRWEDWW